MRSALSKRAESASLTCSSTTKRSRKMTRPSFALCNVPRGRIAPWQKTGCMRFSVSPKIQRSIRLPAYERMVSVEQVYEEYMRSYIEMTGSLECLNEASRRLHARDEE